MIVEPGLDSRCWNREKIVPPHPLPHVSRRSLKKVVDRVRIPTLCQHCGDTVSLVENSAIYGGRSFGKWPYAYMCNGCRAYVGLHPDTDLPLGTLADLETREARKAAKIPFTSLVRNRFKGDRKAAYSWLSVEMEMPKSECHFGFMDVETANRAFTICFYEALEVNRNGER